MYIDAGYIEPNVNAMCSPSRWGSECKKFPIRGRGVSIYKQTGPKLWERTSEKLPDKLCVFVVKRRIDSDLSNELIKVRRVDSNQADTYVINEEDTVKYPYWDCSYFSTWVDALNGLFQYRVAQLSNPNAEVIDSIGRWVNVNSFDHSKLFCISTEDRQDGLKVRCYVFKRGQYKADYWFNPGDLSCIDQ